MAWPDPRPNAVDPTAIRERLRALVEFVDAELEEITSSSTADLAAHLADASDAHDASSISLLDTAGDFSATNVEAALAELQARAEALWQWVNTDSNAGRTLYVGSVDPAVSYTPVTGDVWIEV